MAFLVETTYPKGFVRQKAKALILVSIRRGAALAYDGAVFGGFKYTLPVWAGKFPGDTGKRDRARRPAAVHSKTERAPPQAVKPAPSRVSIIWSSL
jgi:hypothetical protein